MSESFWIYLLYICFYMLSSFTSRNPSSFRFIPVANRRNSLIPPRLFGPSKIIPLLKKMRPPLGQQLREHYLRVTGKPAHNLIATCCRRLLKFCVWRPARSSWWCAGFQEIVMSRHPVHHRHPRQGDSILCRPCRSSPVA